MHWIPLEANPEVFNTFLNSVSQNNSYQFCDIYGFEDELLAMVPEDVCAVALLFPLKGKLEHCQDETCDKADNVVFMKQTIGNACGTMALLHIILNNKDVLGLKPEFVKSMNEIMEGKSPEERAAALEKSPTIEAIHSQVANMGQTAAPAADEKVALHFVAFVAHGGKLFELDGRRDGPICRGEIKDGSVLKSAVGAIKNLMAIDPSQIQFNAMALAKAA